MTDGLVIRVARAGQLRHQPAFLVIDHRDHVGSDSSVFQRGIIDAVIARLRRSGLKTLPTAVLGNSSSTSTYFGIAARSCTCTLQCSISSAPVAVPPSTSST